MDYYNIATLTVNTCPEKLDNCANCPYFCGVEDGMVRCYRNEDKPFNNERN